MVIYHQHFTSDHCGTGNKYHLAPYPPYWPLKVSVSCVSGKFSLNCYAVFFPIALSLDFSIPDRINICFAREGGRKRKPSDLCRQSLPFLPHSPLPRVETLERKGLQTRMQAYQYTRLFVYYIQSCQCHHISFSVYFPLCLLTLF